MGNINPGELFSEYMKYLPGQGTIEGRGGYLFPKPRDTSRTFDIHSAGKLNLFQPNQPVGKNTISNMLSTLCDAVQQDRATNHMLRVTAIKYLRRSDLDWLTISKITGHKNLVNLIKNYDLNMEGPGLVNVAAAIATGPEVAQGEQFEEVVLSTKRAAQKTNPPSLSTKKAAQKTNLQSKSNQIAFRQPSFPVTMQEKLSSRGRQIKRPISYTEEVVEILDDDNEENSVIPETGNSQNLIDHENADFDLGSTIVVEESPPKKVKTAEERKKLGKLLNEYDREREDKINYIKGKFDREINEKEEKQFKKDRMEICYNMLKSKDPNPEDIYDAKVILKQYEHEEKLEAWKSKKEKEEKENLRKEKLEAWKNEKEKEEKENQMKEQFETNHQYHISNRQPLTNVPEEMSNMSALCRPTENLNGSATQIYHGVRPQPMPPHMMPPPQMYHHYQQPPYMQPMSYHNSAMMPPMTMPSPIPYSMPFPYAMPSLVPYGMHSNVQYPTSAIGPYVMPTLTPVPEAPSSVSAILHSGTPSAPAVGSGSTQMQSREVKVSSSDGQGNIVVTRKEEKVVYENNDGKQYQARDLSKDDTSRNILGSGAGDRRVAFAKHSAVDWSKK